MAPPVGLPANLTSIQTQVFTGPQGGTRSPEQIHYQRACFRSRRKRKGKHDPKSGPRGSCEQLQSIESPRGQQAADSIPRRNLDPDMLA
jgi:hypothetical protein